MAFQCPECYQYDALDIALWIQFEPDRLMRDITMQVVRCNRCGFQGMSVYQESRHGRWESEGWEHAGYWVDDQDLQRVINLIQRCPNPADVHCGCAGHQAYGIRDETGRWQGMSAIKTGRTFTMRLTS